MSVRTHTHNTYKELPNKKINKNKKQNRTPGIMVNNCNPSTQKVEGGDQNFEVSLGYTMNKYSK